jgi:hypothetical protein
VALPQFKATYLDIKPQIDPQFEPALPPSSIPQQMVNDVMSDDKYKWGEGY